MQLEDILRNLPWYKTMMHDTEVTRQEVIQDEKTGERIIVNHRRFIPGSLQAKRRPLS